MEQEQEELRIILNIFVRLPVKTLLRFRCLSRFHRTLIDHSHFSDSYNLISALDQSRSGRLFLQFYPHHPAAATPSGFCPFAHPDGPGKMFLGRCFTIIGSCFGVLCLASTPYDVCLWNPSTRTHRHLSLPNYEHFDGQEGAANRLVSFGIGCDPDGNTRLLRFVVSFSPESRAFRGEAAIYSLRSDTWQTINCQGLPWSFYVEGLDHRRINAWEFGKSGVFVINKFYWIVKLYNHQNGAGEFRILSLNLEDYTFGIQKIPPFMISTNLLEPLLNVDLWPFDGTFCASCHFGGVPPRAVVWVNGEDMETWRNLLVVEGLFRRLKPLSCSEDKKKVLLQMDSSVVWYDFETKEYRDSDVDRHGSLLYDVEAYFETLVFLNDAGRCLRS